MNASRTADVLIQKKTCKSSRSGVAAAEFAICLPFLLAMTFGTIETTNAIFVKRSLVAAAYEGANVASSLGGTSSIAKARANGVAKLLGVNSMTVNVSPAVTTNTPTGTTVTVTCTTTLANNTVTGWCLGNMTLTTTCTAIHL